MLFNTLIELNFLTKEDKIGVNFTMTGRLWALGTLCVISQHSKLFKFAHTGIIHIHYVFTQILTAHLHPSWPHYLLNNFFFLIKCFFFYSPSWYQCKQQQDKYLLSEKPCLAWSAVWILYPNAFVYKSLGPHTATKQPQNSKPRLDII